MYERSNHLSLMFLAATAFTFVMYLTKTVMVPFAFALFVYAVFSPILQYIQVKWRMPRAAAIAIAIMGLLLISVITFSLMSVSIRSFMVSADIYRDKLQILVVQAIELANKNGISIDAELVRSEMSRFLGMAGRFTSGVFTIVGDFLLVVIFALFMIGGSGSKPSTNPILKEIEKKVFEYVTYKFFLSTMTGLLVGIVLLSFNIELAFLIAILTVWLNFIPNFGSLIASALPIPIILVEYGADWRLVTVLILVGTIQFLIGNVLEPKLLGDSMDLHPVTILFFLMFWGLVWGVPGMFLAVPITVILKIVVTRLDSTRPFGELLAGRFS